jgi:putative transposase
LRDFDYSSARTYFVTICVLGRQKVFQDTMIAAIAHDELMRYRDKGWYWLLAFVVMPDHLHFLVRLREPAKPLGRIVAVLKSSIQFRSRRVGVDLSWQDYFHDHIVRPSEDLDEFVQYILRNPERARLVQQGVAYPFAAVVDSYR